MGRCFRTQTISVHTSWFFLILYLFYPDRKLNPGQSQNVQVLPTSVGEENTSTTIQTSTWTEGHLINFDELALFDSESCVVWNTSFTLLFGDVAMRWSILLRSFFWWDLYVALDHYASSLIQYHAQGVIWSNTNEQPTKLVYEQSSKKLAWTLKRLREPS